MSDSTLLAKLLEKEADLARVTAERDAANAQTGGWIAKYNALADEYRAEHCISESLQGSLAASQARCAALEKERDEEIAKRCNANANLTHADEKIYELRKFIKTSGAERDQLRQQLEEARAELLKAVSVGESHDELRGGIERLRTALLSREAEVERLRGALGKALSFAVCTLAFHGRDRGTDRQEGMLYDMEEEARKLDTVCRAALAATSENPS